MAKIDLKKVVKDTQAYYCLDCGVCTGSCPVSRVEPGFSPRLFVEQILYGFEAELLESKYPWFCATCFNCIERCPSKVQITELINAIKEAATQAGHGHPAFDAQVDLLRKFGRLYEIDDFDNKRRGKMGLPEVPKTCEDIAKILDMAGVGTPA